MAGKTSSPLRRLVLTGYMGSGKTTVGRLLAHRLGWTFADLDEVIAAGEGLTVPQIFAERGESAFRAAEGVYLKQLLRDEKKVIALGGGAPETEVLRAMLQQSQYTAVVFLRGNLDALYARCVVQGNDPLAVARPLLEAPAASQTRFERRQTAYAAVATHTVDACLGTADEVAEAVLRSLVSPHSS